MYLRLYSRYLNNSQCVILDICCQMQDTSARLPYVNSAFYQFQFCRICLKYSIERINVSNRDMSTIRCKFFSTFVVKYSAHRSSFDTQTLESVKYSVIAVLEILPEILNCTNLSFCSRYMDDSMCVILHICCHVQSTCSFLHYVNYGRCKIRCYCSAANSGFNIALNVSTLL